MTAHTTGVLDSAYPPATSRLMVLMFTDIAGSVALKSELGLPAYSRLLARHDALFRSIVAAIPRASILQDTGDGFYASFATPADAVTAALRFQHGIAADGFEQSAATGRCQGGSLSVRVGIHLGQMERLEAVNNEPGKIVGLGADLAARVMGLAMPGQVLMTRAVFDDARLYVRDGAAIANGDAVALQWLAHGRYRMKGQDEPLEVYEVGLSGFSPLAPPPDSDKARRFIGPDEEQMLGWRPAAGREVPGRTGWFVDRKLGEGGFGEVWLARHKKFQTERVFKFCFDATRLRGLKREMTLFRLLRDALGNREDIASLHEVRLDQPPFFLESDFTPLGDLSAWSAKRGGIAAVPLETRIDLVAGVAEAVSAAHSVGILHKDIKPSNILIHEKQGRPRPRLADFGIGILTDRSRLDGLKITAAGFTETSSLLTANESSRTGTRMYAPPEMLQDKPFTTRGDVYALGVLLYQMVVADLDRPLAEGWQREVSDEMLREDIAACVEGDPERRMPAAAELATRLRTLPQRRQEREAETQRRADAEAARRLAARRRAQVRIVGVIAAGLAVATVVIGIFMRDAQQQRREADRQRIEADRQRSSAERQSARAQDAETTSRQEAQRARTGEAAARNMLARIATTALERSEAAGDPATAFLWAARSLAVEDDPSNRIRAACYQRHAPRLVHSGRGVPPVADWNLAASPISRDGRRVAGLVSEKTARVWDAVTLQPASPPMEHPEAVLSLAISPNGQRLLTGSLDGSARVWDANTGKLLFSTPERGVALPDERDGFKLSFSPDGRRFLTAVRGDGAEVWNTDTGVRIALLQDPDDVFGVDDAIFSPDGARVATCYAIGITQVWDVATAKPIGDAIPHRVRMAFSQDGTRLVTAEHRGPMRIWDARTGKLLSKSEPISSAELIAFSPDARRILTGGHKTVQIWHADTGKPASVVMMHEDFVTSARFNADASRVVTVDQNGNVREWDATSGAPLTPVLRHSRGVAYAAHSADGNLILVCGVDGTLRAWDVSRGGEQRLHKLHGAAIKTCRFSADGRMVLTASSDGTARVWDAQSLEPVSPLLRHAKPITSAVFNPDNTRVATASDDGTAVVWGVRDGVPMFPPIALDQSGAKVIFSPDGALLATVGATVRVFNTATGAPVTPPLGPKGKGVWHVGFSKDSRRIGACYVDAPTMIWDVASARPVLPPTPYEPDESTSDAVIENGFMVTGAQDGTIRIRDLASGRVISTISTGAGAITELGISRDGSRVAAGGLGLPTRVWDTATGQPLTVPITHIGGGLRRGSQFSPDGSQLVSLCDAVRVWNAQTGQPLSPLVKVGSNPLTVHYSPDGRRLIAGCEDGSVFFYDLSPSDIPAADLAKLAEVVAGQRVDETGSLASLASEEWRARWSDLTARYPQWFEPPQPTAGRVQPQMRPAPTTSRTIAP